MIFFILYFIFIFLLIIYHLLTKKYVNPYTITLFFGRKGCGKSTILTAYAIKALKQGKTVYTTEDIEGCITVNYKDIGKYHFEPDSLVLVDEAGLLFDNRNFKSFSKEMRDFITLVRHYRCQLVMCSQVWDNVDLKIRQQLDYLYLVKKHFRVFTVARCIQKQFGVYRGSSARPSDILEEYSYYMPLLPSSWKIFFIPKWSKFFDSFAKPDLPVNNEWVVTPIKSIRLKRYLGIKRRSRKRKRRAG